MSCKTNNNGRVDILGPNIDSRFSMSDRILLTLVNIKQRHHQKVGFVHLTLPLNRKVFVLLTLAFSNLIQSKMKLISINERIKISYCF